MGGAAVVGGGTGRKGPSEGQGRSLAGRTGSQEFVGQRVTPSLAAAMNASTISQSDKKPGVLDHLSEGMSQLVAVPQLMLVPILLDLYLQLYIVWSFAQEYDP